MEQIVVKDSPRKWLVIAGISALLLLVFVWIAIEEPVFASTGVLPFILLIGVVLWSTLVVLGIRRALRPRERLRIDGSGLTEVSWKVGVIPWEHVESAFVKRVLARRYLCLRLRDEGAYLQRMPRFIVSQAGNMRSQGLTPFAIDSAGLDRPFDQVIDAVAARVPVDGRQ